MNKKLACFCLLLGLPGFAHAHIGHLQTISFTSGLLHPLAGIDHILVMVAIGMWAMRSGGKAIYILPLTFIGIMAASALSAMTGIELPYTETGILISNAALIALVLISYRFTLALSMGIVALFALFHGFSHGLEMPANAESIPYILGFVMTTLLLQCLGIYLAYLIYGSKAQPATIVSRPIKPNQNA